MDIGDSALARVQEVDECHNVVLTMKGVGLRRLSQGAIVEIPVNHIDRIRGENNSHLDRMKDISDCRIIIGENGRVWIDGDDAGISWTRDARQLARLHGQRNFDSFENTKQLQRKVMHDGWIYIYNYYVMTDYA